MRPHDQYHIYIGVFAESDRRQTAEPNLTNPLCLFPGFVVASGHGIPRPPRQLPNPRPLARLDPRNHRVESATGGVGGVLNVTVFIDSRPFLQKYGCRSNGRTKLLVMIGMLFISSLNIARISILRMVLF